MVLYHGTTREFKKFDLSKAGRRDSGNMGRGVYLSKDPTFAMRYAEANAVKWGEGAVVLKVDANLRKVADFGKFMSRLKEELGVGFPPKPNDPERSEILRQWFMEQGYDAAESGSGNEIVVFDPTRLKIVGREDVPTEAERLRATWEHYESTGEALQAEEILKYMENGKYTGKKVASSRRSSDLIMARRIVRREVSASSTPTLDRLIEEGLVWIEGNDYVGKAADGETVSFGLADDRNKKNVERYLKANPKPEDW